MVQLVDRIMYLTVVNVIVALFYIHMKIITFILTFVGDSGWGQWRD